MRLKNKVFLSLCAIWVAFLSIIFIGAHTYFFNSLLQAAGGQNNQDVIINHYAISHIINHYLVAFIFIGLLFASLGWYLLRSMFLSHCKNLKDQLHAIDKTSDYVKRIRWDEKDELYFMVTQFNHMMDNIQRLQTDLVDKVGEINQLYDKVNVLEQRAVKADRADRAFHTVCDLLNNIATSTSIAREKIENSKAEKLIDLARLLTQEKDNLSVFMTDTKGQQVPLYLTMLAQMWADENKYLLEEIALLSKSLTGIKNAVKCFDRETIIERHPSQ